MLILKLILLLVSIFLCESALVSGKELEVNAEAGENVTLCFSLFFFPINFNLKNVYFVSLSFSIDVSKQLSNLTPIKGCFAFINVFSHQNMVRLYRDKRKVLKQLEFLRFLCHEPLCWQLGPLRLMFCSQCAVIVYGT